MTKDPPKKQGFDAAAFLDSAEASKETNDSFDAAAFLDGPQTPPADPFASAPSPAAFGGGGAASAGVPRPAPMASPSMQGGGAPPSGSPLQTEPKLKSLDDSGRANLMRQYWQSELSAGGLKKEWETASEAMRMSKPGTPDYESKNRYAGEILDRLGKTQEYSKKLKGTFDKDIDTITDEAISLYGDWLLMDRDGVKFSDPTKTMGAARYLSSKLGIEDEDFQKVLYDRLKSKSDAGIVAKEADKKFEQTRKGLDEEFGKRMGEAFTEDDAIAAAAKARMASMNADYSARIKADADAVSSSIKQDFDAMDAEVKALNADYEARVNALNKQIEAGAIPQQQAEEAFAQMNEAYKQQFAQYEQRVSALNAKAFGDISAINRRYNSAFTQEQKRLIAEAEEATNRAAEKFAKEFVDSEEGRAMRAKYKRAYEEDWKRAMVERGESIQGAADKRFEDRVGQFFGNPIAAFAERFAESTVSGLGGSIKGMATTTGLQDLYVLGEEMERITALPEAKSDALSDLLEGRNLAQLSGQLAGGMAPSIAATAVVGAATGGMSIPARLALTGVAGWGAETMDLAGRAYDDMLRETRSREKASEAAYRTLKGQVQLMPAYAFDGLPFIGKALDFVPTKAGRIAAGGMTEYGTEMFQEIPQSVAEKNIREGREPYERLADQLGSMSDSGELRQLLIGMAPITVLGGAGQVASKSAKRQLEDGVKEYILKSRIAEVAPDVGGQWVDRMQRERGTDFTRATIASLMAGGHIDEAKAEELLKTQERVMKLRDEASRIRLNDDQARIYTALGLQESAMRQRAESEQNPILKKALENRANEIFKSIEGFVNNGTKSYVEVKLGEGNDSRSIILDTQAAGQLLNDSKFISEVAKMGDFTGIDFHGEIAAEMAADFQGRVANVSDIIERSKAAKEERQRARAERLAPAKERAEKQASWTRLRERLRREEDEEFSSAVPSLNEQMEEAAKAPPQIPIADDVDDEVRDAMIARRAELGVAYDPLDDLPESVAVTFERVEDDKPVSPFALDAASDWLYKKYKDVVAMRDDPKRLLTLDQIDSYAEQLGKDIELLENHKQKLKDEAAADPAKKKEPEGAAAPVAVAEEPRKRKQPKSKRKKRKHPRITINGQPVTQPLVEEAATPAEDEGAAVDAGLREDAGTSSATEKRQVAAAPAAALPADPVRSSGTPIRDEYYARIEAMDSDNKRTDIENIAVGDYVAIPPSDKSSGATGFVTKVGRKNIEIETTYGGYADADVELTKLSMPKASVQQFVSPKQQPKPKKKEDERASDAEPAVTEPTGERGAVAAEQKAPPAQAPPGVPLEDAGEVTRESVKTKPVVVNEGGGFRVDGMVGKSKAGQVVVEIRTPQRGTIAAIDTEEDFMRKGVGATMMTKAASEAWRRGVRALVGALEGTGTVGLREKVFGPGATKYYTGAENPDNEVSVEDAIRIMDVDYGRLRAVTNLEAASGLFQAPSKNKKAAPKKEEVAAATDERKPAKKQEEPPKTPTGWKREGQKSVEKPTAITDEKNKTIVAYSIPGFEDIPIVSVKAPGGWRPAIKIGDTTMVLGSADSGEGMPSFAAARAWRILEKHGREKVEAMVEKSIKAQEAMKEEGPREQRAPAKDQAFNGPAQIKSATGNYGTFDPSKPSILEQRPFRSDDADAIGFNYTTDAIARERFDLPSLEKIGSGSDRDVYDLGDGRVLKIAKTARGLEQNMYEGEHIDFLPDTHEKGMNYVVVDKVEPAKASDVIEYEGYDGGESGTTTIGEMLKDLSRFSQRDADNHTSEFQDAVNKYGFNDVMNYNILWNDFIAKRNWGVKDGRAIHLDGGTFGGVRMIDDFRGKKNLDDADFREIYNRSRAAKKQFGDRDKATMYQRPTDRAPKTGKPNTDKVIKALAGFGVKVVEPSDKQEYLKAIDNFPDGVKSSWGLYDHATSTIYVNPEGPDLRNTLFHEAAHPVLSALMRHNPTLRDKFFGEIGDEKMPGSDMTYRQYGDKYSDKRIAIRMEEAIAQFTADVSDGKVKVSTKPDSLWQRFKAFIKDILAALGWDMRTIDLSKPTNVREFAAQFKKAVDKGIRITGLDPVEGTTLSLQDDADRLVDGWYSRLDQAVAAKGNTQSGADWMRWAEARAKEGLLSMEEVKWTGLADFLQGKAKVTPKEVRDFLKENRVKVEVKEVGGNLHVAPMPGGGGARYNVVDEDGNVRYSDLSYTDAGREVERHDRLSGRPRFSQYQLPGGTNYREVLVTLPKRGASQDELDAMAQEQYGKPYSELNDAQQRNTLSYVQEARNDPNYRSSHFPDTPNPLLHLRVNDRTGPNGEKILFIEELQSDWGASLRKEDSAGVAQRAKDAREKWQAERERLAKKYGVEELRSTDLEFPEFNHLKELHNAMLSAEREAKSSTTPSAPFVTSTDAWVELGLKQAIRMAVDGGYDRIAWTTGEQQNERYDLSKQVDNITWEPSTSESDGARDVRIEMADNTDGLGLVVGPDGVIQSVFDGAAGTESLTGKRLDDVVGKEVARRIMNDEGSGAGSPAWDVATKPESIRELGENVFGAEMASMMPLEAVDGGVLAALKHDQVRRAVVSFVPVDVVNILRGANTSAERLFRQPEVVFSALPVDSRRGVALGVVSAMRDTGAAIRAKLESGLSAGRDELLLPTLKTSDLNAREVAGLLDPERLFHGYSGSAPKEGASTGSIAKPLSGKEGGIGSGQRSATELAQLLNAHAANVSQNKGTLRQGFITPDMRLSGAGLKTEAQGMKGFYDKILPTVAKKVSKRLGGDGAVGDVVIGKGQQVGNQIGRQQSISITQAMRERVGLGVPLMQRPKTTKASEWNAAVDAATDLNNLLSKGEEKSILDAADLITDPDGKAEFIRLMNEQMDVTATEKAEATESTEEPKRVKKTITTKRAYEGEFRDEVKKELEKIGLYRSVENREEARGKAAAFVAKVGADAALDAVRNGDVRGAEATYVFKEAISDIQERIANETDAEALAELYAQEAALVNELNDEGTAMGRFIGALGSIYEEDDLGFRSEVKASEWRKQFGEEPSAELMEKWKQRDKEFAELEKKLKDAEERAAKAEEQAAVEAIKESIARERRKPRTYTQKSKDLADRFRKLKTQPMVFKDANGNVIEVKEMGFNWNELVEVGAKAIEKTGQLADGIAAIAEKLKASGFFANMSDKDREAVMQQIEERFRAINEEDTDGRIRIPKQMIREAVIAGAEDIDTLVDVIMEQVKDEYPDATKREIRDAITEYGKVVNMSQDEISAKIRRMKDIGRTISAIEDVENRIRPLRSGLQRDKLDAEQRALKKKLREMMKELPIDEQTQLRELRTALDAAKSRTRNRIEDMEREIEMRERIRRSNKVVEPDAELQALIQRKEDLQKEHDEIFKDKSITEEERLKRAVDSARRSLDDVQRKIREMDIEPKKPTPLNETPELRALRDELGRAREEFRRLQEEAGIMEKRRLDAAKKMAAARIDDYRRRLEERDFSKKEKKAAVSDTELERLRAEKIRLKEEYDKEFYKESLRHRTVGQWIKDFIWEAWGFARAVKATSEISFVLIQGGTLTVSNLYHRPSVVASAFRNMWDAMKNEKKSEDWLRKIKAQDWYPVAKEAKLAITEPHAELSAREELFVSDWTRIFWDIIGSPLLLKSKSAHERWSKANPFRALERGAVSYLDTLRVERFLDGMAVLDRKKAAGEEITKQDYKDVADAINTLTGRASLGKNLDPMAKTLTKVFFSPRLWASGIKTATPYALWYFGKMRPTARKLALQDLGRMVGTTMGIVALAAAYLNNDDDDDTGVEMDPLSSDFGKIKLGEIRVDPWSGRIQQVVLTSRLTMGGLSLLMDKPLNAYKDKHGQLMPLGSGSAPTMGTVLARMATNKLSPAASMLVEAMGTRVNKDGTRSSYGKEYSIDDKMIEAATPIYFETISELVKEDPGALEGFLIFYAFFGGGVSIQEPSKKKSSSSSIPTRGR